MRKNDQLYIDAEQTIAEQEELLKDEPLVVATPPEGARFVAKASHDPLSWRFLEARYMRQEVGLGVTLTPLPGHPDKLADIHATPADYEVSRMLLGLEEYRDRSSLEKYLYRVHGSLFAAQLQPGNRVYERLRPGLEGIAGTELAQDHTHTDLMRRGFMTSSVVNTIRYIQKAPHFDQLYEATREMYGEFHEEGYRPLDHQMLANLSAFIVNERIMNNPAAQDRILAQS